MSAARNSTVRWLRGLATTSKRSRLRPGKRQRPVEHDGLTGTRRRFARKGMTRCRVLPTACAPFNCIATVRRRQEIEDRRGTFELVWSHRFIHVLVAEDIALAVTRVVSDETDGGEDCALIRGVTNMLDSRVIDAHGDERGAQHLGCDFRPRVGELRVEILTRAEVAVERLHVEPSHDGPPFDKSDESEKPGVMAGLVSKGDRQVDQDVGSRSSSSGTSVMPSSAA